MAYTASPVLHRAPAAGGTNCGAFTKLLLGSREQDPMPLDVGEGVLIWGNEHRVNKGPVWLRS